MRFIGEDIAKDHGYVDERGYTRGVWVTYQWDDGHADILNIHNDQTECLINAIQTNKLVAFIPYGQGREYVRWTMLGETPTRMVDIPPG